jgi:hypothetical protein
LCCIATSGCAFVGQTLTVRRKVDVLKAAAAAAGLSAAAPVFTLPAAGGPMTPGRAGGGRGGGRGGRGGGRSGLHKWVRSGAAAATAAAVGAAAEAKTAAAAATAAATVAASNGDDAMIT